MGLGTDMLSPAVVNLALAALDWPTQTVAGGGCFTVREDQLLNINGCISVFAGTGGSFGCSSIPFTSACREASTGATLRLLSWACVAVHTKASAAPQRASNTPGLYAMEGICQEILRRARLQVHSLYSSGAIQSWTKHVSHSSADGRIAGRTPPSPCVFADPVGVLELSLPGQALFPVP